MPPLALRLSTVFFNSNGLLVKLLFTLTLDSNETIPILVYSEG